MLLLKVYFIIVSESILQSRPKRWFQRTVYSDSPSVLVKKVSAFYYPSFLYLCKWKALFTWLAFCGAPTLQTDNPTRAAAAGSLSTLAPNNWGGDERWTNWFVAVAKIMEQFLSLMLTVCFSTHTRANTLRRPGLQRTGCSLESSSNNESAEQITSISLKRNISRPPPPGPLHPPRWHIHTRAGRGQLHVCFSACTLTVVYVNCGYV